MEMTIYGAEAVCASCAQAPSSTETAEWLRAAIGRKFGEGINIRYIDIDHPETGTDRLFCEKIVRDEYFYPLVVACGTVLGEGIPNLKPIIRFLEQHGFKPKQEHS